MYRGDVTTIAGWALFLGLISHSSAQTTPYGDCPASAQQYQNRYQTSGNVSEFVCLNQALQRELGAQQSPLTPTPTTISNDFDASKALSHDETYCLDQQQGPGSLTKCLIEQNRAGKEITAFLDKNGRSEQAQEKIGNCTGYTTGGRDLGSMENVDQAPLARCVQTTNPRALFETCIQTVTNKIAQGITRFWSRKDSDQIAACFNARTGR